MLRAQRSNFEWYTCLNNTNKSMGEYVYDIYDEVEDVYEAPYDDINEQVLRNYETTAWKYVYENCVFPTLLQISTYVFPFMIANMLLCIGSKIRARYAPLHLNFTHILSFICGLFLLYNTIESGHIYLGQLLVATYVLLKISLIEQQRIRCDFAISIFAILYLFICEIYEKNPKVWHHIRGVLMIVVMKSISLAFDMKDNVLIREHFTIVSFLGYICCPGNCIFGPWISFTEYINGFIKSKSNFKLNINYFMQLVFNLILSISCLLFSNCMDTILISDYSWKWINAYGSAFSFRMSHYFVSYLSQATMVAAGFTSSDESVSKSNKQSRYLGYVIVRPWDIELPRSLVHVVVAWNISMHCFLKQYIFRSLKPYGIFLAIFLTYVSSSLLHGINFQLWATLLTLGVWSYVEYNLRKKLGHIFSACVMVNKCSVPCTKHKLGSLGLLPIVINSIFFLLCFINLTYLGAIFDASSQLQSEGFALKHTLDKWHNLDFASHWLLLFGYLFHWLI